MDLKEQTGTEKREDLLDAEKREELPDAEKREDLLDAEKREAASDADNQEVKSNSEVHEPVSEKKDSKNEPLLSKTNSREETTEDKQKKKIKIDPNFLVQALIAVGTLIAAFVGVFTLFEMRTGRDIEYQPEIVNMPISFKGGKADPNNLDIDKDYMYIDLTESIPTRSYSEEQKKETDIYFEEPYLSLKNIGQGTAKDVRITFHNFWIIEAVTLLNNMEYGDYDYQYAYDDTDFETHNSISVDYYDPDINEWFLFLEDKGEPINIPSISPDDDIIKVYIPFSFDKLLALVYFQRFYNAVRLTATSDLETWQIFGPINSKLGITIQYYDMQGNEFTQNEVIPFYLNAQYKEAATIDEQLESLEIKMAIESNYVK